MNNLINLSSDNSNFKLDLINVEDCETLILLSSCGIFIFSASSAILNRRITENLFHMSTDGCKMISSNHLSSYESLENFNSTHETLKINDDYIQKRNNILNTNRVVMPAVCDILSMNPQYHHDRWVMMCFWVYNWKTICVRRTMIQIY